MLIYHALAVRVIVKMLLGEIHIHKSHVDDKDTNNCIVNGDNTKKQTTCIVPYVLRLHADCHEQSEETK